MPMSWPRRASATAVAVPMPESDPVMIAAMSSPYLGSTRPHAGAGRHLDRRERRASRDAEMFSSSTGRIRHPGRSVVESVPVRRVGVRYGDVVVGMGLARGRRAGRRVGTSVAGEDHFLGGCPRVVATIVGIGPVRGIGFADRRIERRVRARSARDVAGVLARWLRKAGLGSGGPVVTGVVRVIGGLAARMRF